jgi:hypothetical protein
MVVAEAYYMGEVGWAGLSFATAVRSSHQRMSQMSPRAKSATAITHRTPAWAFAWALRGHPRRNPKEPEDSGPGAYLCLPGVSRRNLSSLYPYFRRLSSVRPHHEPGR